MTDEVEQEFKCEHGVMYAQRRKSGVYVGSAKVDVCPKCRKKYLKENDGPHYD
jgi:predicted  nucleic acid-binding Zn ribbon protein